jgi:hypothetical protein
MAPVTPRHDPSKFVSYRSVEMRRNCARAIITLSRRYINIWTAEDADYVNVGESKVITVSKKVDGFRYCWNRELLTVRSQVLLTGDYRCRGCVFKPVFEDRENKRPSDV